jgi:hypothetical protein
LQRDRKTVNHKFGGRGGAMAADDDDFELADLGIAIH